MAKGISAVIATIMLLMITVALIGVFYIFGSGLLGATTTSATGTVGAQVSALTQTVSIPVAKCTSTPAASAGVSFTIQNTGSNSTSWAQLGVYIDNLQQASVSPSFSSIAVGEQKYVSNGTYAGVVTAGTVKTIRVVSPAGPVSASVTCA